MKIIPPDCPYCQRPSVPATGADIYKHRPDLAHLKFFWCEPCLAYVGTHRHDGKPLGTLANAELRKLRNEAHAVFDPIWLEPEWETLKERSRIRRKAYAWLAQSMGLTVDECHIAMFNEDQCKLVIKLCRERKSP